MIKVSLDPVSQRGISTRLNDYKKLANKTNREITIELAKACAKEIANRVQPFGLSAKVGKAFEGSIAKQVNRAIRNAEISGDTGTAEYAHKKRRDNKGQVPRNLRMKGRRVRSIPPEDASEIVLKKKQNAGMVKGAWIAAAESLGGKISGIPKWIRRHAGRNGTSDIKIGSNASTVTITNTLGHARSTLSSPNLNAALKTAYNKQWKRMTIQIKKIEGLL